MVSVDGLRVDESKIKAIRNWPRPCTITEVSCFHGLETFYQHFIPYFNSIMASVIDCMKGSRFQWTKEAEDVFQLTKVRLLLLLS